ncbi:hypothetical protein UPYG_G00205840 [Umbra pygmaea]|uniref:Peptidase S54 rhomboid domain-containing protein n=1 Tax=Umbra pygmaea TaxID=75934 RepID=A0ABD0WPB5_UMBPY
MIRGHRGRGQLGLIFLATQFFQIGVDNIPPVTLVTLGVNVCLFMVPAAPLLQTCISVEQTCWNGDWRRLFFSPVHHIDDWHLYFNMASLLWKGVKLEPRLGSNFFAYLLAVFSLLTGVMYLLLEMILSVITNDPHYNMECAVGFSGVLFALKVLRNHYHPGGMTNIVGVAVSNRYASWVELVVIHLIFPGTSFVGHLAGILVGLLYTIGPLKIIMKKIEGIVTAEYPGRRTQFFNSSGYSGRRDGPQAHHQNDHPYTEILSEEEQYDAAIRASLNDRGGSTDRSFNFPGELTAEEIRRLRLQRFT